MSNKGLNRVTLFGNLGADPELRTLQSGKHLLKMRLATSESYLKEGVREERTEWHQVVMWGPRAEGLARILRKGSFVLVEGQLRTHSFEKDGEKRYVTEVHADNLVLGGRRGQRGPSVSPPADSDFGAARAPVDPREPDAPEPAPVLPEPRPLDDPRPGQLELPPPPPPPRKKTRTPMPAPAPAMAA